MDKRIVITNKRIFLERNVGWESQRWEKIFSVKPEIFLKYLLQKVVIEQNPTYIHEPPYVENGKALFYIDEKGYQAVLIETLPCIREVMYIVDKHGNAASSSRGSLRKFSLAFPYVYFYIQIVGGKLSTDSTTLFYRNTPIINDNCRLYQANINNNGCWGNRPERLINSKIKPDMSISKKIEIISDIYWHSIFNGDLSSNWNELSLRIKGHPKNIDDWGKKTLDNPNFILKLDWSQTTFDKISFAMFKKKARNFYYKLAGPSLKRHPANHSIFFEEFVNYIKEKTESKQETIIDDNSLIKIFDSLINQINA